MCTTPVPSPLPVALVGVKGDHRVYVTVPQHPEGDVAVHRSRQFMCRAVPLPTAGETFREAVALCRLAFPIALTALLLYSRMALSMLFLGTIGDLPLAAGSLAIAFANITGYSVLSGLSLGMDPLCSQAFGANQPRLLGLTLYRSVLFLFCCSLPLTALWLNMSRILVFLGDNVASRRSRGRCRAVPRADQLRVGGAAPARRSWGGRRGVRVQLRAPRRASGVRRRPARLGASSGGAAHGGVPRRLGSARAAGSAQLCVGVPGVVVVRGDDPALRPPARPEAGGSIHGRALADDGAGVRVPVIAGFWRLHAGGQRAWREPAWPRACRSARGRGRSRVHGSRGHVVRSWGAPHLGPYVHRRPRHTPADRGRASSCGALRARKLPADRRLRRSPR
uniref:Protein DETOXIFICATION n=1 Tax=Zea mays TaxID=4577 RepID=A0A804R1C8_MAIZE